MMWDTRTPGKYEPNRVEVAKAIEADRADHVREIREAICAIRSFNYDLRGHYDRLLALPCLQLPEPDPSKEAMNVAMEWLGWYPGTLLYSQNLEEIRRVARIADKHMRPK